MGKLNIEELKALIAKEIKKENLHQSLPDNAIEEIKNRILVTRDKANINKIPNIVSEELNEVNPNLNGDDRRFPDKREIVPSPEKQIDMTGNTTPIHVDAGEAPLDQSIEPKMGYSPELPDMLKKAAPGELFVFQYNDVTENGENLSFKQMRLMSDPDIKKSMNDLWIQEGKTKADVYVAKFEKIGEIDFNYTDGTSRFNEKPSLPDYVGGTEYKNNPYTAESTPQIDEPTKNELETYIKSSVDLEKVVHEVVMGIIKDSLLTNTEKAVNEDIYDSEDNRENYGYNVAQAVKPMEEGFNLSMQEIVDGNEYEKIVLPKELNEAISSGNKSLLIKENQNMQQWSFKNIEYFVPTNRISKTKGYKKI